ncbi:MAG: hypothetical protein KGI27_10130 [Thaumarchaeota archaeon]|nr:hypothetical protein [Nitrososphaerota archaeon]
MSWDIKFNSDHTSVISVEETGGGIDTGLLLEAKRNWADELFFLQGWGYGRCGRCGRPLLQINEEVRSQVVVQGRYCRHCRIVALRTRYTGRFQYWDNGAAALLPSLIRTIPDKQYKIDSLVIADHFLGWLLTTEGLLALYPFGWDLVGRSLSNGKNIIGRTLELTGVLSTGLYSSFPQGVGIHSNWLVIDLTKQKVQPNRDLATWVNERAKQLIGYRKSPLSYSADNAYLFLRQLNEGLADRSLGTTSQQQELLAHAKALGFLKQWDKEAWQATIAQQLSPWGDPAKILQEKKVLKAHARGRDF